MYVYYNLMKIRSRQIIVYSKRILYTEREFQRQWMGGMWGKGKTNVQLLFIARARRRNPYPVYYGCCCIQIQPAIYIVIHF